MNSNKDKDSTIHELREELHRIRAHLSKSKLEFEEAANKAAEHKLELALEDARHSSDACLERQRTMLEKQAEQDRIPLQRALEEARSEAERWKVRLKECDERRMAEESNCAKEMKRAEALKAELAQVNEDLLKSKRQMTGDELRHRLDSLKEVVSHTLRKGRTGRGSAALERTFGLPGEPKWSDTGFAGSTSKCQRYE